MDFVITSRQIVWICGFIASIWGMVKIIKELKKPSDDLKKLVKRHSELLDNDNRRLQKIDESHKMTMQCLLVMLNHEITGNGIENMKEIRDQLQDYLINK